MLAYKIIILQILFYSYKMWSLTLKEEYTLQVFENNVLKISIWTQEVKCVGNG